jgi:Cd2+/Zn2+-exporting ATPase
MNVRTGARTAATAGALLLVALVAHLVGGGAADRVRDVALVVAALVAGVPTAVKALRALRARAFSIDLLVTIAVTGALAIGEYVEAAVVAFLFVLGAYLEARTLAVTRASLRALIDQTPQEAVLRRPGPHGPELVSVPVDDVAPGDVVVQPTGSKIAVDGVVSVGRAAIDEATITGEPLPAAKSAGDEVYAGTIVTDGFIDVIARKTGDDTTFAQIIELVEDAQDSSTRTQRFLDRFATIYTPAIVVASLVVLAVTQDVRFALTFLVIACPGALVIATPVSMVAGLGNGARHGVLVKGGDALERLARADTLVLDKTGTLTLGRPTLTEVVLLDTDGPRRSLDLTGDDALALAARLEAASEHPLGRAVVEAASVRGLHDPARRTDGPLDVEVVAGGGIRGTLDGREIVVGSPVLAERISREAGSSLTVRAQGLIDRHERAGSTVVVLLVDGTPTALLAVTDQVRPGARDALDLLRRRGITEIHLLTGDNLHAAQDVADELGIEHVQARLLPQDKAAIVARLQSHGRRVAMVGDGINDAPAIATADVGIAMGAGTDVSVQTADVVLLGDRLDQLVHARSVARATVRTMRQNTAIALVTVVALLVGVLAQVVLMAGGMLVHEASVLLVVLNAVRLVRYRDRELSRLGPTALAVTHPSGSDRAERSPTSPQEQDVLPV